MVRAKRGQWNSGEMAGVMIVARMIRARSSPAFDRLMTWSLAHALPTATRYLLATLIIAATAILRALLVTSLLPWLLFLPPVLGIGLVLGRGAGLYAAVLSAACAGWSIGSPHERLWLSGPQWVANAIYLVVATGMAAIAGELRDAFSRAARGGVELATANALLMKREEQLQLLNQELGHRLKNQLAIVQAVASQTMRQAGDLRSANEALSSRLAALGRATDVLTRSDWTAADLHTLAQTALMAHQSVAGRFHIQGPALRFGSQVSLALTLAFHELMTNAIKYGALSNDEGHVDLGWSVQPGPNGGEPRFNLVWREVDGPQVRPPVRRGFGSMMIERSLRAYFRGDTAIDYDPAGLVFRIDAPLGDAQEG
ncbi:sensor histidine kinase [Sphingomonas bacterium]|uniref:sensor histidine kinase n=1 Tax=Sphingomonas bacterium TaxID=1895847 RepID=UPI0020C5EC02|nr:HWE histidine kinase domain-containing protein [Sphingomonas bacterium]